MKQYGYMRATEFTKKQIGVIFAKAKNGELKVEEWFMHKLYSLADYYGYDSNRSVEDQEREVKWILEAVFANNNEEAQDLINKTADIWFNSFSFKKQKKCDRTAFVS